MKRSSYYWAGLFTWACLHSLFQDAMGQEGMRHIIDHHWADSTYTVAGSIVVLVLANGWIVLDWLYRVGKQAQAEEQTDGE